MLTDTNRTRSHKSDYDGNPYPYGMDPVSNTVSIPCVSVDCEHSVMVVMSCVRFGNSDSTSCSSSTPSR